MYLKSMHTSETVERAGGPQAAVTGSWHGRQWRDFKRYSAAQRLSRIGYAAGTLWSECADRSHCYVDRMGNGLTFTALFEQSGRYPGMRACQGLCGRWRGWVPQSP